MSTSYGNSLELDLTNPPERNLSSTFNSNHDWKLSPNVQVKIILKRLQIQTEINDHNRPTNSEITPVPRGAKRKRMSNASSGSPTQTQTETSESDVHSSSDEAMEELEKIVLAFEPECSICCKFAHQFSRHIRNLHSLSPPPSAHQSQSHASSVKIETEIFTVVPPNNAENNNNVCDKLLPSTADPQTRLESNIKSEIQESHQMNRREIESEVTGRRRKTNEYAESTNEPQPTATIFTGETDILATSNDIHPSLTAEYVKCEPGEIEITDNYDLFQNSDPEGHDGNEADSDVGDHRDEGNDSDSELEGENSLGKAATKSKQRTERKLRNMNDDSNQQFKCDKCEMHFLTSSSMRRHSLNKHPDQRPYKCDICPSGFKKFLCLVQHKKTHTAGESNGSSSVIPRKTIDVVPDSLTETDSKGVGTGQRRSSRVRKKINYAEINEGPLRSLSTHTTELEIEFSEYNRAGVNNSKDDSSDAEENESYSDFEETRDSMTAIKISGKGKIRIGPYKCDRCDLSFSAISSWRRHLLVKHPIDPIQTPFKCDDCYAGFKTFKRFALHKKSHKGEKSNKTHDQSQTHLILKAHEHYIRGKYFRVAQRLTRRRLIHPREFHNCETCGNAFGKKCVLVMHERLHTGERPYKCEHCDKCFISNIVRITHEGSHKNLSLGTHITEETTRNKRQATIRFKPRNCEKCDLHFYTTMNFNRHNYQYHNIVSPTLGKYKCQDNHIELRRRRYLIDNNTIGTEKESHKCTTCGKRFIQKHLFIRHKRLHRVKKLYKCECCSLSFSSKEARIYHTINHSISRRSSGRKQVHYCHMCRLNFPTEKVFLDHIKSTHQDNFTPYMCNICQTGFPTGSDIRKHFRQTHPKSKPKKIVVNESDSDVDESPDFPYKCDHCNRGFQRPKNLELHMPIHTKEKPHKCEACGKNFYLKDVLICHQQESRHSVCKPNNASEVKVYGVNVQGESSVKRNYGCGICTREYKNVKLLTEHLQRAHINFLSNKLICKFCKERFFTVLKLTVHVGKVHPGEKPFECKICHKEFTKQCTLIDHSTVHKDERTIPCTHKGCTKMFKKMTTMKRHLIIHSGAKPYKCGQCGKTFAASSGLYIHRKIHTGDKPFMCEVCSTCFSTKQALKLHMLSRHKEVDGVKYKPHVCKDCGKCFTLKGQLATHSKIHTGEKSHMCEECGICFRLPHQLRAHLKTLAHAKREEL